MSDRLLTDSELNILIVTAKQQVKDFYENIGIPQAVKAERERVYKIVTENICSLCKLKHADCGWELCSWIQQLKQEGI